MRFELNLSKSFRKQFTALEKNLQQRVVNEIETLLENPRKQGVIQLTGRQEFRTRVGDYRIIFAVDEENRIVTVLEVGHRSEVYDR
jgi:mRNA interferase RelE/StbE